MSRSSWSLLNSITVLAAMACAIALWDRWGISAVLTAAVVAAISAWLLIQFIDATGDQKKPPTLPPSWPWRMGG